MGTKNLFSYIESELKHSSLDEILQSISDVLKESKYPSNFARKVYSISSECLENMYSYSVIQTKEENICFEIASFENEITISCKNYLKTSEVKELESRIQTVNTLKQKDLKPHFVEVIKGNKKSKKGGAGLGLIMMKRKSSHPFEYAFEKVSRTVTEFTLKLIVSIDNMKTFRREKTRHTPFIQFDLTSEQFELSGQSRPENADSFYDDILLWITMHKNKIKALQKPVLSIDLEYYNSSSLKNLVRVFRTIAEVANDSLKIEWYYDYDDESAREDGIEIGEIIKKTFTLIEK